MDIKAEILDYINQPELAGALLLTGQWGCGKSYLIKEIAKELNAGTKVAITVISLFGLDSIAAINKRVKDEYTSFMLGTFGKTTKKVSKALANVVKDSLSVASIATNGQPGLSAAAQGLSSIMNYDVFGLVEVKNTIGKDDKERKFVIVFDDLERNNLDKKDLLGAINEYVENKHIKVIVIADQDKIDADEYKEYKEKIVSRTIKMSADYESLIKHIIYEYSKASEDYHAFLSDNLELLWIVFTESKSNNLRTLKAILADFKRIYDAWIETEISTDNMKWALYTFAAEMFISKATNPSKGNNATQTRQYTSFNFEREKEQFEFKGKNNSSFSCFRGWINRGTWDKDTFIKELRKKYSDLEKTPVERFLLYSFWYLQQEDIDVGLPEAVNLAYEGKLSRQDLIGLLTKIHYLKENSIELPCEVDYTLIENGLKQRMDRIKLGTINEPECHTFAMGDQIDIEAREIYNSIEKMEDKINAWQNRDNYIKYLQGDTLISSGSFDGHYMDELDDELLDIFKQRYSAACNGDKRDYAGKLVSMIYNDDRCSDNENIQKTKENFNKLVEWLEAQNTDDSMTLLINRLFVNAIKESKVMSA